MAASVTSLKIFVASVVAIAWVHWRFGVCNGKEVSNQLLGQSVLGQGFLGRLVCGGYASNAHSERGTNQVSSYLPL